MHAYEKCLLAMKAYPGGGIEFEPGLSEEKAESGDEGAYEDEVTHLYSSLCECPQIIVCLYCNSCGSLYP